MRIHPIFRTTTNITKKMHYTSINKINRRIDRDSLNASEECREAIMKKFEAVNYCIEDFISSDFIKTIENGEIREVICKFCFEKASLMEGDYNVFYYGKKDVVILNGGKESLAFKSNGKPVPLEKGIKLLPSYGNAISFPFQLNQKVGFINDDFKEIIPPIFHDCSFYNKKKGGNNLWLEAIPFLSRLLEIRDYSSVPRFPVAVVLNDEDLFWGIKIDEAALKQELDDEELWSLIYEYDLGKIDETPLIEKMRRAYDHLLEMPHVVSNDDAILNDIIMGIEKTTGRKPSKEEKKDTENWLKQRKKS